MLLVGREINIKQTDIACRKCGWGGAGSQLSKGLLRIEHTFIYLVAYRCPTCGSSDLALAGQLLPFRLTVRAHDRRDRQTTLCKK